MINEISRTDTVSSLSSANLRKNQNNWTLVRHSLPKIVEHGKKEGIITRQDLERRSSFWIEEGRQFGDANGNNDDVIRITTDDSSLAHAAIPFLPVPVAIACFILNLVFPGLGTVTSGLAVLCVGQSRLKQAECRQFSTFLINLIVGVAQLATISFLLVGWFWSIAWGSLMITHSLEYRMALIKQRQEAIAVLAVEAISKDPIIHHKQVSEFVQQIVKEKTSQMHFGLKFWKS